MGFKHETKMRAASRWFLLGLGLALATLGLLQAESGSEHVSSDKASPLFVEPSGYDFSENPKLLKRILSSPHGYFRFINIHFGQVVCTRYAEMLSRAPRLNLHGDAHIEQYAVTDLGRGLTDFDDSSSGPGLLDLLRFGVSLRLTLAANGRCYLSRSFLRVEGREKGRKPFRSMERWPRESPSFRAQAF